MLYAIGLWMKESNNTHHADEIPGDIILIGWAYLKLMTGKSFSAKKWAHDPFPHSLGIKHYRGRCH